MDEDLVHDQDERIEFRELPVGSHDIDKVAIDTEQCKVRSPLEVGTGTSAEDVCKSVVVFGHIFLVVGVDVVVATKLFSNFALLVVVRHANNLGTHCLGPKNWFYSRLAMRNK